MNFNFSKLIHKIESELKLYYQSGAIKYIDENFDGAWSKEIDKFEQALASGDQEKIEAQSEIYKGNILKFIDLYKRKTNKGRAGRFLDELKNKAAAK